MFALGLFNHKRDRTKRITLSHFEHGAHSLKQYTSINYCVALTRNISQTSEAVKIRAVGRFKFAISPQAGFLLLNILHFHSLGSLDLLAHSVF